MRAEFSEFSFGYALIESLIRDCGHIIEGPPLFPSLRREGQRGGGYDVALQFVGRLLFLQFKLSDYMVRNSAIEVSLGLFDPPFYRMHLAPSRLSGQHQMLLELEANSASNNQPYGVFYAAPLFHSSNAFSSIYMNREIVNNTLFVQPSEIGELPDTADHHLSFRDNYLIYFLSNQGKIIRKIKAGNKYSFFDYFNINKYKHYNEIDLTVFYNSMVDIIARKIGRHDEVLKSFINKMSDELTITKIQYLSRMFFGCELLIIK